MMGLIVPNESTYLELGGDDRYMMSSSSNKGDFGIEMPGCGTRISSCGFLRSCTGFDLRNESLEVEYGLWSDPM